MFLHYQPQEHNHKIDINKSALLFSTLREQGGGEGAWKSLLQMEVLDTRKYGG